MTRLGLAAIGLGLLTISCSPTPPPTPAAAGACSPSVTLDGFSDALDKTRFQDSYVGNFSALAPDADGRVLALSDRSVLFTLDAGTLRPAAVLPLADEGGRPLDSEGLAVDRDGTLLVSSETEPSVRRDARDGRALGQLPVPDNVVRRSTRNQTLEGLTLRADGHELLAAMEGPLSGDAPSLVRFVTWQRTEVSAAFRQAAQYAYRVDPGLGVSEVADTGDGRLFVLERGFIEGVGNTVRLQLADPRGAVDVGAVTHLTDQGPAPIAKTLLADLAQCPTLGATSRERQPNPLLDNIEGLAVTGRDPAGATQLLLVSDDNERAGQTTRFYRLTVQPPQAVR